MLDKYYGLFGDMTKVQEVLALADFPQPIIDNAPKLIPNFLLLVIVLFFVKRVLNVFKILPTGHERYERFVAAGAPFSSGWMGGMLADLGLAIGLMGLNFFSGKIVSGFQAIPDQKGIVMKVLLFVLVLLEVAFICAFYVPLVMNFISNIRVWGFWGIFETVLTVFLGLSVFIFIFIAVVIGFLYAIPAAIFMFLCLTGMYGIAHLILLIID